MIATPVFSPFQVLRLRRFCGQVTIYFWILLCAWGYCVAGRSSVSLLAEATRFLAKMSWYWVKFMMPLTKHGPQDQWRQNSLKTSKIHHHILQQVLGSFLLMHPNWRQAQHWCAGRVRTIPWHSGGSQFVKVPPTFAGYLVSCTTKCIQPKCVFHI